MFSRDTDLLDPARGDPCFLAADRKNTPPQLLSAHASTRRYDRPFAKVRAFILAGFQAGDEDVPVAKFIVRPLADITSYRFCVGEHGLSIIVEGPEKVVDKVPRNAL